MTKKYILTIQGSDAESVHNTFEEGMEELDGVRPEEALEDNGDDACAYLYEDGECDPIAIQILKLKSEKVLSATAEEKMAKHLQYFGLSKKAAKQAVTCIKSDSSLDDVTIRTKKARKEAGKWEYVEGEFHRNNF